MNKIKNKETVKIKAGWHDWRAGKEWYQDAGPSTASLRERGSGMKPAARRK